MRLKGPWRVLALLYTILILLPVAVLLTALFVPGAEGGVFFIFPFVVFSSDGGGTAWVLFPLLFMVLFTVTVLYIFHLLFRFAEGRHPPSSETSEDWRAAGKRRPSGPLEEGAGVGTTGIILLGPIPIIFSTSRGESVLFLFLPLILVLLLLAFVAILLLSM